MGTRGFSLLEVIIALAVLSSLAVGPILSTRHYRDRQLPLESALISQMLERLSLEATQRGEVVELVVTNSSLFGTSVGGTPIITHTTPRAITLHLDTALPRVIRFYPSGVASPSTLSISTSSRYCTVVLSLRGRIRTTCQDSLG